MKHTMLLALIVILLGSCTKTIYMDESNAKLDGSDSCCMCTCRPDTTTPPIAIRPIIGVGSSTMFFWPDSSFTGYHFDKKGFPGYSWGNLRYLVKWDSIIQANPKQIVLYSGDNDIVAKRSLTLQQGDFQAIVKNLMTRIPDLQLIFLYTKPSDTAFKVKYPSGETGINVIEYFNRNMNTWGTGTYGARFISIDTYSPEILWNPKRINTTFYKSDLLHLNDATGYRVWNTLLRPKLIKE